MAKDYYKILGIEKNASTDEVKKAFHKLAHKYHPDKKEGNEAKFKEINEAYQVLHDDNKRQEYDTYGRVSGDGGAQDFSGFKGFDFSNFNGGQNNGFGFDFGNIDDIFSEFFGGAHSQGGSQKRRGRDISTELHISFEESIFGGERKILINKVSFCDICNGSGAKDKNKIKKCATCNGQGKVNEVKRSFFGAFTHVKVCESCYGQGSVPEEKCSTCHGAGTLKKEQEIIIKIPTGIRNGEMVRVTGMGEAVSGGLAGDLYIKINVLAHPSLRREGNDLVMDLEIKLSEALLGTEKEINSLDGKEKIKIPEGVTFGEILKLREKGVILGKNRRGDLLINLIIKLPKKLNKKEKELVEELKKEGI